MCTSVEPASQGQDSRAGTGSQTATARPTIPAPTEIATVSSCLSDELLSSAFQPAWSSAAPSTAAVTGSEISITRLADQLLEERADASDGRAPFLDRLFPPVVLHGAEIGQQRCDQHVGRVAGETAARHALLDDVERGIKDLEDRRHSNLVGLGPPLEPARTQPPEPAWLLLGRALAAVAVGAELSPAQVDCDHDVGAERPAHRHRHRIDQPAVDQHHAV